jgi:hypothetical protein
VPDVGTPSDIKDEAEGLKREAEKDTDMSETKKRKWEEEKDTNSSDNNKTVVIITCLCWWLCHDMQRRV